MAGEMHGHGGSPSSSCVAKRTRRQWEMFYRNWHNEVKKKRAGESCGNGRKGKGVGNNEGSYSVNPENDEISRENNVIRRTVERSHESSGSKIIGKKADEMGSVSGGIRGKRKLDGVKVKNKDVKHMGEKVVSTCSCSKSGSVSCKKCGFHNVCTIVADTNVVTTVNDGENSGVRSRGRPRNEPLNKGNEASLRTWVNLGEFVDSEDSEDSEGSCDVDEDYEASSEEDEDDSDEANLCSSSGEADISDCCSEETDDETYFDNSVDDPIVRPEEKEQPVVDHSLISGHSDSLSSNFNQQTEDDDFFDNDVSSAGAKEKEQSHCLSSSSSDSSDDLDSLISDVNYVGSAGHQGEKERHQSLNSGDFDVLKHNEDDEDAYCNNQGTSPVKMKVDQEEKDQTSRKNKITNEERLASLKRKYEPYVDGSQEDGDGTDTVKLSKEDRALAGTKRPYSNDGHGGIDAVKSCKEEKRQKFPVEKSSNTSLDVDVDVESKSKSSTNKDKDKDSHNTKCVQRTGGQKGARKARTFDKVKTSAPTNLGEIKEADESTPGIGKKKTGTERNHLKVSVDSIDKEASQLTPTPTEKRTNIEAIKMLVDLIDKEADGPCRENFLPLNRNRNPNSLPLKFRFQDEEPSPPQKSEWEKPLESLFCDLNMGLRETEPRCTYPPSTVCDDESVPQDIDSTPAARCLRGEHDPVLDEQIGVKCKYCSVVLLEIEDILPPFYTPPSRRQDRREFGESHNHIFDQIQFQDHDCGINPSSSSIHETGRDTLEGMYPHQQEGFKFMWKNIARDGNGCIISHAPGTGKTRLTIVFLQAFMNKNPKCRPVIIAPRGMLLTWEDEFRKWGFNVPFHNLNKLELSEEENAVSEKLIGQVGSHWRIRDRIRFVKVISWLRSKSILGVSYPLFEKLAGEHQREDQIREFLLNKPGLLVLDEGHTPRSDQSLTWKALTNVATNRRIMLSGTPFQNNFEELYNTLCLVNPLFADQMDEIHPSCKKRGRKTINRSRGTKFTTNDELMKLRSMIDPFVHVHKGSILQESLPGLRDSLVFLRPTELQKSLLQIASKGKPFFQEVCLVSLISVHPSLVAEQEMFCAYKSEIERIESRIDAGVKTKFVIKLAWLADALGERVLVFSHFIDPLVFIKQQLQSQFSWNEGREVVYMDGKLDENQRQYSINSFNDESSEAKVLLASQKACSEGINLVGASRVVLLDTAWNPSVERQAISRAYRLGQKKVVHVYRLITSGTVEVQKYASQAHKDRISQLIFSPTDEPTRHSETSKIVSEDKVLEALVDDKSLSHIFEKIIHQPKASELIHTFDFTDLNKL